MKRKTGLGSIKRGRESVRHLQHIYENTENLSSYDLAKRLIEENIPDRLKGLVDILARAAAKVIREKQLRMTCKMMEKLIEYEVKNTGYNCKKVKIWKDFNSDEKNIFKIEECDISCPEKIKTEFEEYLFGKYGLNFRFNSP